MTTCFHCDNDLCGRDSSATDQCVIDQLADAPDDRYRAAHRLARRGLVTLSDRSAAMVTAVLTDEGADHASR